MANAGLTWTEERIDLLTRLWTEGLSASQIAAELGGSASRSAVISKARRLRLVHGGAKGTGTPSPRKLTRAPDQPLTAKPPPARPRSPASVTADQQPTTQGDVAAQPPGVTIMELRDAMCRWPLGDPTTPGFRFCGARPTTDLPYCAHHAEIAYQPAAERKRLRA